MDTQYKTEPKKLLSNSVAKLVVRKISKEEIDLAVAYVEARKGRQKRLDPTLEKLKTLDNILGV